MTLDSESKNYECSVYHFFDAFGTIGGIFELLFGAILMLYNPIRKNMYYYSHIAEIHKSNRYNWEIETERKAEDNHHQNMQRNVFKRDPQLNEMIINTRLQYNHDKLALANRNNLISNKIYDVKFHSPTRYKTNHPCSVIWESLWWYWKKYKSKEYKSYMKDVESFKINTNVENIFISIQTLKAQV